MLDKSSDTSREALVIAHPGHEMCVYGWLKSARPDVFVLTDGSGGAGRSRIDSSQKILSAAQAKPGQLFGCFTDREVYRALLHQDLAFFERITTELARHLVAKDYHAVTGDAAEGYNPIHDVCRMIINAATELAMRESGRKIVNRQFLLFGKHQFFSEPPHTGSVCLKLSDEVLEEKVNLARSYPELKSEVAAAVDGKMLEKLGAHPQLRDEVAALIANMGREAYRVEYLGVVECTKETNQALEVPFYERYAELLVSSGIYDQPIRYSPHVRTVKEHLQHFGQPKLAAVRAEIKTNA